MANESRQGRPKRSPLESLKTIAWFTSCMRTMSETKAAPVAERSLVLPKSCQQYLKGMAIPSHQGSVDFDPAKIGLDENGYENNFEKVSYACALEKFHLDAPTHPERTRAVIDVWNHGPYGIPLWDAIDGGNQIWEYDHGCTSEITVTSRFDSISITSERFATSAAFIFDDDQKLNITGLAMAISLYKSGYFDGLEVNALLAHAAAVVSIHNDFNMTLENILKTMGLGNDFLDSLPGREWMAIDFDKNLRPKDKALRQIHVRYAVSKKQSEAFSIIRQPYDAIKVGLYKDAFKAEQIGVAAFQLKAAELEVELHILKAENLELELKATDLEMELITTLQELANHKKSTE